MLERLPLCRDRPALAYAGTLLICSISLVVRLLAGPILPSGYPFVSFFPAVVLSTFLFGLRPGICAATLCGLAAWYCFIPPNFAVKLSGGVLFAMSFYVAVVVIDIWLIQVMQGAYRRLSAERQRSQQLAERGELLFRELQHRVSNNLQVVSGLLSLQKRDVVDEDARLALDEAARRLGLIGRIHRQLYNPNGEQLHLSAFLDNLAADLIDASGKTGICYGIDADEDVDLAAEAAVPMALIVAEAMSNAIEHGFADRDRGAIEIRVVRDARALEVMVIDDGAGLPPGFALANDQSLGLRLAQMLARQLDGEFSLIGGDRTTALLRLPPTI